MVAFDRKIDAELVAEGRIPKPRSPGSPNWENRKPYPGWATWIPSGAPARNRPGHQRGNVKTVDNIIEIPSRGGQR
jgi:hypothetical protein